jgi:thioredoxin 1
MARTNRPIALALAVTLVLVGFVLYRAIGAASRDAETHPASSAIAGLPTLIELGSDSCSSCLAMRKVLTELERRHAGRLNVESVDVVRRPDQASRWRIRVIPTQVFLDGDGREITRHLGYLSAQAVEARFRAHGIGLDAPVPTSR